MLLVITAQNQFFVVDFSMDREPVVNASEAGPSAYATYREASLSQLERYMAEATALSAERKSLGKSAADKKRRDAIDEDLADIRGNSDALRLCLGTIPGNGRL